MMISWSNAEHEFEGAFVHVRHGKPADHGSRRVILLHGNPGAAGDWAPLFESSGLVAEWLAVDFPGFSGVPRPATGLSGGLAPLARLVVELTRSYAWDSYEVWGHSHGAGVAMAVAGLVPQRVERLVLVGSLGSRPHAAYRQLAFPGFHWFASALVPFFRTAVGRTVVRGLLKGVAQKASSPAVAPPSWLAGLTQQFERDPETLLSMVELSLGSPCLEVRRLNEHLTIPTVFIHGAKDRIVPVGYARELHERRVERGLPSRLEVVPEAGHLLPITHPTRVAELLVNSPDFRGASFLTPPQTRTAD